MRLVCGVLVLGVGLWATAAEQNAWSTIKGQVVFGGTAIPQRTELKVDKDQDHCLSKGKILSEEWLIDESTKGVRNVVVWLAPLEKDGKLPIHPDLEKLTTKDISMDQPCCMFIPRILAMREGQTLVVKNSSPIGHNISWSGIRNTSGNVILPAGKEHRIDDAKASRIPINASCSIHSWMTAKIRVFNHPYYAVTDEKGNFTIPKAPAGKYRIVYWHETGFSGGAAGSNGTEIEIKGETMDLGKVPFTPAN